MTVTAAFLLGRALSSPSLRASPGRERSVLEGSSNIISKVDLFASLMRFVVGGGFFPLAFVIELVLVVIWYKFGVCVFGLLWRNHSSVPGKHTKMVFY